MLRLEFVTVESYAPSSRFFGKRNLRLGLFSYKKDGSVITLFMVPIPFTCIQADI